MVVLAVNIVGNRAAEGDILRPGRDRKKEAARHREVKNLRKGDAGLGGEDAGCGIERQQPVHAGCYQQIAAFEQADIAIAAAHAHRQAAVVEMRSSGGVIALPLQGDQVRVILRITPPRLKR